MKKEVIISLIIGALLGFGTVGLIWVKKQKPFSSQKQTGQTSVTPEPTKPEPKETPAEKQKPILEVLGPSDASVSNKEKITVSGKTSPQATVVVVGEENEDIIIADENGNFKTEITLIGGENLIEITTYTKSGEQESKSITVTYSTAKF